MSLSIYCNFCSQCCKQFTTVSYTRKIDNYNIHDSLLCFKVTYFVTIVSYFYRIGLCIFVTNFKFVKLECFTLGSIFSLLTHISAAPCPIRKHWNRLKKLARAKHSSLLRQSIFGKGEKGLKMTPAVNVKNLLFCSSPLVAKIS